MSPVPIRDFRHKGLERFFATGKQGRHSGQARRASPADPRSPQCRDERRATWLCRAWSFTNCEATRTGTWAVKVSGNWRVTFSVVGKDVAHVDYEDYH